MGVNTFGMNGVFWGRKLGSWRVCLLFWGCELRWRYGGWCVVLCVGFAIERGACRVTFFRFKISCTDPRVAIRMIVHCITIIRATFPLLQTNEWVSCQFRGQEPSKTKSILYFFFFFSSFFLLSKITNHSNPRNPSHLSFHHGRTDGLIPQPRARFKQREYYIR